MSIDREQIEVSKNEMSPSVVFRKDIFEKVKNKNPLYIKNTLNGDNLIRLHAYRWAIQKFMREKGEDIALEDINIQLFDGNPPSGESDLVLKAAEAAMSLGIERNKADDEPISFYGNHVRLISTALGIQYSPEDLNASPLPVKTNLGPLKDFEKSDVLGSAHLWREKAKESGCKEIVVVVQGGSSPEKRFSDQQVMDLIKIIKAKRHDAYVVVVSDRGILKLHKEDEGTEETLSVNLMRTSFEGLEEYSPENLAKNPFANVANGTIPASEINTVGALGIAADLTITTDSFLAWYISGCQHLPDALTIPERKLLVLYTLANKDLLKIPESIPVASILPMGTFSYTNLPTEHYQMTQRSNIRGISKKDMRLLKSAIRKLWRTNIFSRILR